MPGNENNPCLRTLEPLLEREEIIFPPAQGVQQPGERVPYPTLQAVANLHIIQMEDLLQLEREVMLGMEQKAIGRFRMEQQTFLSSENPESLRSNLYSNRMSRNKDKHLLKTSLMHGSECKKYTFYTYPRTKPRVVYFSRDKSWFNNSSKLLSTCYLSLYIFIGIRLKF